MPRTEASAQTLADLLAQVGRAAYCMSPDEDLTPAQWMALRYLSRANRFSRTVSAFADYHATTRGTASQTVKRLIEQGYLTRTPSTRDGRSVRLDLTRKGRGTLLEDPLEALVRSVDGIPRRTRADMTRRLEGVLEQLAGERDGCLFGTCPSCRHLHVDGETCCLFDEPLQPEELAKICVNFAPIRPVQSAT
ncbi:MAG: MarR family transcriptional regulator [Gemmatimonadota bacterium]